MDTEEKTKETFYFISLFATTLFNLYSRKERPLLMYSGFDFEEFFFLVQIDHTGKFGNFLVVKYM